MRKPWEAIPEFWRVAAIAAIALCILAGEKSAGAIVFGLPHGRSFAGILEIMRSQVILYNPAVTGYYETLFARTSKGNGVDPLRPKDRSFRSVRMRPGVEGWTNSLGLVGPEISQGKPPNVRRVAIFGDSLTEGFRASSFRKSYPAVLEQLLNSQAGGGRQFEVLNFAVSGYKLTQILDAATEEAPRFEPDVYVLTLTELQVFKPWDEHLVQLIRSGMNLKYEFLRDLVHQAGAAPADDSATLFAKLAPYRMQALRVMLSYVKSMADARGAQFLVMLVPAVEDGDVTQRRFSGIRQMLESLDIVTVDALDTFNAVEDLDSVRGFPADIHPNNEGYKMIGENLYAKFRTQPVAWATLVGDGQPIPMKNAPARFQPKNSSMRK